MGPVGPDPAPVGAPLPHRGGGTGPGGDTGGGLRWQVRALPRPVWEGGILKVLFPFIRAGWGYFCSCVCFEQGVRSSEVLSLVW